jgi:hypothetical protein
LKQSSYIQLMNPQIFIRAITCIGEWMNVKGIWQHWQEISHNQVLLSLQTQDENK